MRNSVSNAGGRIEAIYFCPHGPGNDCDCRKPKPGLLRRFAEEYQTSLQGIPFIGDSYRDVQAGIAAGAEPFLVKTGNGQVTLARYPDLDIPVFENLYDASRFILSGR
jgi:D-glycero-D-manno-heptose 1,7-bisphosphate phosphatase